VATFPLTPDQIRAELMFNDTGLIDRLSRV